MKTKSSRRSAVERRVLDSLTLSVLLFDHRLRLIYVNAAGEMLFALSSRQMLGVTAAELLQCPSGEIERSMRGALISGQPITERDVVMPIPNGSEVTLDCAITPIRDPGYRPEFLVELQQKDQQLRISREELLVGQQQAVKDLVRGLAHEVKNPLGGLRGAAQLLHRELRDVELREYTQIIIAEADRLENLVSRMLGPNKVPDPQEINIHQITEHVRSLARVESADQIGIHCDYDPSIPPFIGDREQLIQAFLNLVRNATQAVGPGGEIVLRTRVLRQYTIAGQRHRLVLKVDVQDNGPGIPAELIPRIFFPMVGTREGGSGLGLSIAQSLISRHGGLIECTSRPGATEFSVLLPLEA